MLRLWLGLYFGLDSSKIVLRYEVEEGELYRRGGFEINEKGDERKEDKAVQSGGKTKINRLRSRCWEGVLEINTQLELVCVGTVQYKSAVTWDMAQPDRQANTVDKQRKMLTRKKKCGTGIKV